MNLVVSRRESSGVGEQIGAGGGGAESLEVVRRREQLILQKPRFETVGLRPQKFTPTFRSWLPKSLLMLALNAVYC